MFNYADIYLNIKRTFMEDSKFVLELKERATGRSFPTIKDLGSNYTSPFEENYGLKDENRGDSDKIKNRRGNIMEEENENNEVILTKVLSLHQEGKTIDEIYSILREQGYSYYSIENAILELIKKEKHIEENILDSVDKEKTEKKIEEERPVRLQEPPGLQKKKIEEERPVRLQEPPGLQKKKIEEELARLQKKKIEVEERPTTESKIEEIPNRDFAPLFVKIGKYGETLNTLQNLETYLNGMAKLFDLVNKLEKIREENISTLNEMYRKASETAFKLSSGLLKPRGMKLEGREESRAEIDALDSVISNLNRELENLREEINKIKVLE